MSYLIGNIIKAFIRLVLLCPFLYGAYVYYVIYGILQQDMLFDPPLSSTLYDVNGELISELYEEKRRYINSMLGDVIN